MHKLLADPTNPPCERHRALRAGVEIPALYLLDIRGRQGRRGTRQRLRLCIPCLATALEGIEAMLPGAFVTATRLRLQT